MAGSVKYSPSQWVQQHNIEALPESVRHRFVRLLKAAAISGEGFRKLNERELEVPLYPGSDRPMKQLRHIVTHTAANVKVIASATDTHPGVLKTYKYEEQFPELKKISTMGRDELLYALESSIMELRRLLQQPGVLERKVQKPFQQPITVLDSIGDLSEHFSLHAQNMIDYYEKYGISRSESMEAALG